MRTTTAPTAPITQGNVMPAEPGACAMVHGLLRGGVVPATFEPWSQRHLRRCATCRRTAHEYARLAGELRALRAGVAVDDSGVVESIARLVDVEIGRRLRRTWAITTVAGGLVIAAGAGVVAYLVREHDAVAGVAR